MLLFYVPSAVVVIYLNRMMPLTINSIVQDGDGYIWFGTQEGLVRFDGVSFTVFDSRNTDAITANVIPVVFVDGKGALWVGASDGLLHYRDGAFEFYGEKSGLPTDSNVKSISEDAAGNLWLGYSSGDKKTVATDSADSKTDKRGF